MKLPDGSYFDGRNGVLTRRQLAALFSNCTLREMDELDPTLFEKRDIELLHESSAPPKTIIIRNAPIILMK